jgi:proline iminopeptidase
VEAELRRLALRTEFGDSLRPDALERDVAAESTAVNTSVNRELGADFLRYFAAPTMFERVRAMELPILLVHGEQDPRPAAAVAALAAEPPHAELVKLPRVGHFPYREAPDVLSRVVRRFLQSLPDQRG